MDMCLSCGHLQERTAENTHGDELGTFTVCEECEASYDID